MASQNPSPSPLYSKARNDRSRSQSLQENSRDQKFNSSPLPIDPTLHPASSMVKQNLNLSSASSAYGDDLPQRAPGSRSSPNTQELPSIATAFPLNPLWHSVKIPEIAESAGSSSKQESLLLNAGKPGSSSGPCPATVVAERKARTRVFLKSDEEKAQLVRLCIANFGDFVSGKEKFWSKISTLYQNFHPEGVAPNVKGYMQRYSVQRKKEVEEALGKSGIAESATEWQQSMDHWLELVRDFEDQSKEEKKKTTKEDALQKHKVFTLRQNMTKSFTRKRRLLGDSDSPGGLENGEDELLEIAPSDGASGNPFPNKKHRAQSASTEPGGDRVFTSHRRTTDRILNTLREGDQEMLKQIREMEQEKMDNWKEIFRVPDKQESQGLAERIGELEKQGQETQETLTNIVSILQGLENRLH